MSQSDAKPRKHTWRRAPEQVSDEELIIAVPKVSSFSALNRALGISHGGTRFVTIRKRVEALVAAGKINIDHFPKVNGLYIREVSNKLMFSKRDRIASPAPLIARIIRDQLKPVCCDECKLEPVWQGKPLPLTLQRVNGDRHDNRLENLRLLCPNCHAQLPPPQLKAAVTAQENRRQKRYRELLKEEEQAS